MVILNSPSGEQYISISWGSPCGHLSCSFIWNIFACFFILLDSLYRCQCIRQISHLSSFPQIDFMQGKATTSQPVQRFQGPLKSSCLSNPFSLVGFFIYLFIYLFFATPKHPVYQNKSDGSWSLRQLSENLDLWTLHPTFSHLKEKLGLRLFIHSFCTEPGAGLWLLPNLYLSSVQFSCSVMSNSLQPQRLQHARPPYPSPTPRVYSNSCPSSQWCNPTISSSVIPFSSCLQSFPASGSFQISIYALTNPWLARLSLFLFVLWVIKVWKKPVFCVSPIKVEALDRWTHSFPP